MPIQAETTRRKRNRDGFARFSPRKNFYVENSNDCGVCATLRREGLNLPQKGTKGAKSLDADCADYADFLLATPATFSAKRKIRRGGFAEDTKPLAESRLSETEDTEFIF